MSGWTCSLPVQIGKSSAASPAAPRRPAAAPRPRRSRTARSRRRGRRSPSPGAGTRSAALGEEGRAVAVRLLAEQHDAGVAEHLLERLEVGEVDGRGTTERMRIAFAFSHATALSAGGGGEVSPPPPPSDGEPQAVTRTSSETANERRAGSRSMGHLADWGRGMMIENVPGFSVLTLATGVLVAATISTDRSGDIRAAETRVPGAQVWCIPTPTVGGGIMRAP